jgi:trimeric autotransporter adhesin
VNGLSELEGLTKFGGAASTTQINAVGTFSVNGGALTIDGATGNLTAAAGTTTTINGALNATGVSTFGKAGDATRDVVIDATGNLTTGANTTANYNGVLNGNNNSNFSTKANTTTTFGVAGGTQTTIDNAGTVTVGVGNPVANRTVLSSNGNVNVGGNFVVNNPGANVNMGENVVHGVLDPIAPHDAANKAYVDKRTNKGYEGTALALAISQPVFLPGQNFAIRAGWGGFEDQSAVGFSAAGVIMRDPFGHGSTVSLDGGIGFGTDYNTVGGKVGVTLGFGGGYAPMK